MDKIKAIKINNINDITSGETKLVENIDEGLKQNIIKNINISFLLVEFLFKIKVSLPFQSVVKFVLLP